MNIDDFVQLHPRLFHMAADGSWPSIRERGLLPTVTLVELCDVTPELSHQLLRERRPAIVELHDPDGNTFSIRDQKPLMLHNLDGTDLAGWLKLLNAQVFFWVSEQRLRRLLTARACRRLPHYILTIDTAQLVDRHVVDIRLSALNSGATIFPNAPQRGPHTFQSISDFGAVPGDNASSRRLAVVEATVVGGVPDIADFTVAVHRVQQDRCTVIHQR
jgi:hypothetical protein